VYDVIYPFRDETISDLKAQFVPRSKHTLQLMLWREIIAVFSEIHTKHINTAVWAEQKNF
jgi:hypothetical protein